MTTSEEASDQTLSLTVIAVPLLSLRASGHLVLGVIAGEWPIFKIKSSYFTETRNPVIRRKSRQPLGDRGSRLRSHLTD